MQGRQAGHYLQKEGHLNSVGDFVFVGSSGNMCSEVLHSVMLLPVEMISWRKCIKEEETDLLGLEGFRV